MTIKYVVPPSTIRWILAAPTDRPVVVLLRHSVRPPLPPVGDDFSLPITETGVALSRELGSRLTPNLRSLHASPLTRCVQTAEALREGATSSAQVRLDRLLGNPGAFVLDDRVAGDIWKSRGHEWVMLHLMNDLPPLPGMAVPQPAARFLVQHMLEAAVGDPGTHVFVTHDSVIVAAVAQLLRTPIPSDEWPWYLEAACFWRDGDGVQVRYRERAGAWPAQELCSLEELDVVEFARRQIALTVGLDCQARFFLAGGAFKTLLHGRPPRDLDLWAASAADREELVRTILARGGRPFERREFSDAFDVGGLIVDVPEKVEPSELEQRLARFDIALSAIGVEHVRGASWRCVVHPLASESVRRREVLVVQPLRNGRHAIRTLDRLRRYGRELGYSVPASEVMDVRRELARARCQ